MKTLIIAGLLALSATAASAQEIKKCMPWCGCNPKCVEAIVPDAMVSLASVSVTDGIFPPWRHPTSFSDPFCHAFPLGCGG